MPARRTRYGLVEDYDPNAEVGALISQRRRALGVDKGPASIWEMEDSANQRGTMERDQIAAMATAMAPTFAKEHGVSEEEAYNQLAQNVAYPEGPVHLIGRKALGWTGLVDSKAPEGEPADVRVSRLQGLFGRRSMGQEDRAEAGKRVDTIRGLTKYTDPRALEAPMGTAMRDSGIDLPDGTDLHLRRPPAQGIVELYQDDPAAAEAVGHIMHPKGDGGDGAGGGKPGVQQQLIDQVATDLLATGKARNRAEARLMAVDFVTGKPQVQGRKTLEETEYEKNLGNDAVEDAIQSEQAAAAEAQANGEAPPPMPETQRRAHLRQTAISARAGEARGFLSDRGDRSTERGDWVGDLLKDPPSGPGMGGAPAEPTFGSSSRRAAPSPAPEAAPEPAAIDPDDALETRANGLPVEGTGKRLKAKTRMTAIRHLKAEMAANPSYRGTAWWQSAERELADLRGAVEEAAGR